MHSFSLHRVHAILSIALWIGLAAPVAQAQRLDPDPVRIELERTDVELQRAEEVVAQSGDPRARSQLQFALGRQLAAWNQFRGGFLRIALEMTLRARELGGRAVRLAQQQSNAEQRAQRTVEEALRAFERAQNCAGDSPPDLYQRMMDLARQQLAQAQDALREQRWDVAHGLATQVLQTVKLACGDARCPRVEERIAASERLYERTTEIVESGDAQARRDLDRARDHLNRARDLLRRAACEPALVQARTARDLLLRLLRDQVGDPSADVVTQVIDATAADIDELVPRVTDPAASALLDKARHHLDRAREQLRNGQPRAALAETRVARNLAGRAARLAGLEG